MVRGYVCALLLLLLTIPLAFAATASDDEIQKCGQTCANNYYDEQTICLTNAGKCLNGCSSAFTTCTDGCGDSDPCYDSCANTNTNCEDNCNRINDDCIAEARNKYKLCSQECLRKGGVPEECVKKYDPLNPQEATECLIALAYGAWGSLPNGGTTPPEPTPSVCGNGVCEQDEDRTCPSDCAQPVCGNNICEPPTETYQNCRTDCVEDCTDGVDNDLNTLVDCADPVCSSNPVCKSLQGVVKFADMEGDRTLPNVMLLVRWLENGALRMSLPFYSNANGAYSFFDPSIHRADANSISVTAYLTDESRMIGIIEGTDTIVWEQLIDKAAMERGEPQDIIFGDVGKNGVHPRDGAKVYAHMRQAENFAIGNLITPDLLLQGVMLRPEVTSIYDDRQGADNACHLRGVKDGTGILIGSLVSNYTCPDAPNNREFHEYGHHIMDTLLFTPPRHYDSASKTWADINHDGIINHCSGDAWVEGFAEFISLVIQQNVGVPKRCGGNEPYRYCVGWGALLVEDAWKADALEEDAVAGILWDLYDNAAINNDGKADDDEVSVDLATLWKTLDKKRDFPLYHNGDVSPRNIWYVKDLYDALEADKIGTVDSHGTPRSYLKDIFFEHGYYYFDESQNKDVYGVTLWVESAPGTNNYAYATVLPKTNTPRWYVRE